MPPSAGRWPRSHLLAQVAGPRLRVGSRNVEQVRSRGERAVLAQDLSPLLHRRILTRTSTSSRPATPPPQGVGSRVRHPSPMVNYSRSYSAGRSREGSLRLQLFIETDDADASSLAANANWTSRRRRPAYSSSSPCTVSDTDETEVLISLLDDSWFVVPSAVPEVVLSFNGGIRARCTQRGNCTVPTAVAQAGEQGRRLQQATVHEASVQQAAVHQATASPPPHKRSPPAEAATDGALGPADDTLGPADDVEPLEAAPPPVAYLNDMEDFAARTPFYTTEETPLREMRDLWRHDSGSPAHAVRKLQTTSPLLWSDAATWGGAAPPNSADAVNVTEVRHTSPTCQLWQLTCQARQPTCQPWQPTCQPQPAYGRWCAHR